MVNRARTDILPSELTTDQSVIVEHIIQRVIPVTYQEPDSRERVRQPREAQDIDGFYTLVNRAIKDKQIDDDTVANKKIIFTEEMPPSEMTTEVITYSLQRREPATFGGKAHQGNHRELKPHIRSIEDDPNNVGFKVVTLGQQFENEIIFTCWAKTNKQVNKRALWFEDFMKEYAWYFKYNGLMECFFQRRLADYTLDLQGDNNTLHARPLVYYVRTERLTHLSEPTIRRIIVQYDTKTDI